MSFKQLKSLFLYLTAFLGGVAGMIVELTAVRLVAPFFGSSMEVWATIIALVMTALALGYFFGGQLSKKLKKQDSAIYLLIASAGLLIGFSYLFVEPIVSFTSLSLQLAKFSLSFKTFLVVLTLFFLPIFLMGSIYPLIITSFKGKKSGQASGLIFAISTAGSIFGTLLPSFVLIPLIGTKLTFFLTGIVLEIIAFIGLPKLQKLIPTLILILLLFNLPHSSRVLSSSEEVIYQTESLYQEIKVIKRDNLYLLSLGPSDFISSSYSPHFYLDGGVFDYFNLLPLLRNNQELKVLILGLGAGTISRQYQHFFADKFNLQIDGVEIDPEVIKVGKKYFELEQPSLTIYQIDGRAFINQTKKQYDVIIVDVYARQTYIPFHLATQEFIKKAKEHLQDDGILAFNVATTSSSNFRYQAISQTIKSVFEFTYSLPVDKSNTLVLASNSPLKSIREINQEKIPEDLRFFVSQAGKMSLIESSSPQFILLDDTAPEKI
jgi:spermidine synthase